MGNIPLETAEKHRGEHAIATVLDQLIQALAIVGARAETEKATVDTARVDAEVSKIAVKFPSIAALSIQVRRKHAIRLLGNLSLICFCRSWEEN